MRIALFSDTFLPAINGVTKTLDKMKDYMNKKGIRKTLLTDIMD